MISNADRREVARRLRSFVTDDSVYADVDACRVLHSIGLYYKDIDRIYFSGFDVARLADLIEPPTRCPHYHSGRHYCSVHEDMALIDRDALLELADEMFKDAIGLALISQLENNEELQDLQSTMAKALMDYARRIREALGVES